MNNILNSIKNFSIGDFITSLKTDKKKLIIVIAVILFLVFLILPKGSKNKSAGIGSDISAVLNEDYYSASGTATLCNYSFDISLSKALENKQFGFAGPEADYSELIIKVNDTLYFNTAPFTEKGGLSSIKCATIDDPKAEVITLQQVLVNSLNSEQFVYTAEENYQEAKISTPEAWEAYFTELADSLKENKESVLKNYTDSQTVNKELDTLIDTFKTIAASKASGNYLNFTLSLDPETEIYTLGIDVGVDFEVLPKYISADSFDANKFTFLCSLTFNNVENNINVPAGYVYAMGSNTISEYIESCWNSLFAKKAYTALNEVTVKADSVTNVINLGATTETYQYIFGKDGVTDAVLLVTSHDENIIKQYAAMYTELSDTELEELVIYNSETQNYSFSISLSPSAIDSVNKIATTPNGLGAFFKTAEGVVPIV